MKIGVIGAGRIGKVHIRNISLFVPELTIKTVADPFMNEKTAAYVKQFGIENVTKDAADILNDPEIEAVVIASSTNTHAQFIIESAKAGKNIFCEKPIDYDLKRVHEAIQAAKDAGVRLQIGFCRRFDHNHRAVYDMVKSGKVGQPHLIRISSRDPEPPSIDYVKVSGGIFYDMMIHDFDMIRYLSGSEVEEVFAQGAVLIDPAIGAAGDVDTATVSARMSNGALALIDNSRKAVYGYDQRAEVFGSKGCVQNGNDLPSTMVLSTVDGIVSEKPLWFFLERYMASYQAEVCSFVDSIVNDTDTEVGIADGRRTIQLALACKKSMDENRPVRIDEND